MTERERGSVARASLGPIRLPSAPTTPHLQHDSKNDEETLREGQGTTLQGGSDKENTKVQQYDANATEIFTVRKLTSEIELTIKIFVELPKHLPIFWQRALIQSFSPENEPAVQNVCLLHFMEPPPIGCVKSSIKNNHQLPSASFTLLINVKKIIRYFLQKNVNTTT